MTGQGVPEQVEGRDRISTGGGDDEVRVGLAGASTRDVVDLGPGADFLGVDGLLAPDARLAGFENAGGAADRVRWVGDAGEDTRWPPTPGDEFSRPPPSYLRDDETEG